MQDQPIKQSSEKSKLHHFALPQIPDKLYFNIGEVAELLALEPYVLRYWEKEFSQLQPNKRRGNRRFYQRQDVLLIYTIKTLLYEKGYTIEGARAYLADIHAPVTNDVVSTDFLREMIGNLENILHELND
ncbi:MAG: MerR family transcriptional regulator [Gammaproteobacteria bacterium]|nr:MerR family transcriptional regulator [Gammaproteobacteria bacterium]